MKRLRSFLALTGLAMLLSGCILVDDFGQAWKESAPDLCISKLAEEIYYTDFRRNPDGKDMNQLTRILVVQGHTYLMLKKSPNDKGGRLYYFVIAPSSVGGGIFQRFRLDPTMRDTFLKNYPNAPVSVTRDTVTLATLDADTEKLLIDISGKPEYWQVEDQALYNPLRDPACRFDNGPLDALPVPPPPAAKDKHPH